MAKSQGLLVPIVYNTSAYDSREALSMMDGVIDIYLPDFKYLRSDLAARYSFAGNYPEVAKDAIAEMVRQRGNPVYNEEKILTSGVLVRILVLPGAVANAKLALRYLWDTYGDRVLYSIMRQYTPREDHPPPLNRRVTEAEYGDVLSYALRIGIRDAFTQDAQSATFAYTPPFESLEGVR
jgi:putative pyruvate formate lyase activating enzyme